VDEDTLERAKSMCITMHQMNRETNAAQAQGDAVNELLGLGYEYDQHYPDMIRKVTAADVQRVAKRLFQHSLTVATKPGMVEGAK
jgi:predicted Zn-dependent peptidase